MKRTFVGALLLVLPAALHAASAPAPGAFASILDFGEATNKSDNTEAIQQAVDTGRTAVVPPGDFAVNGTVVIASKCLFRQGGIAIKLNPVCNGNLLPNNFFYKISHNCLFADDVTENLFQGCFVHFSAGVTVIRLQKCGYNHFYCVLCEPGPNGPKKRPSRYCDISEDSFQTCSLATATPATPVSTRARRHSSSRTAG
jgi:hypothetical protein